MPFPTGRNPYHGQPGKAGVLSIPTYREDLPRVTQQPKKAYQCSLIRVVREPLSQRPAGEELRMGTRMRAPPRDAKHTRSRFYQPEKAIGIAVSHLCRCARSSTLPPYLLYSVACSLIAPTIQPLSFYYTRPPESLHGGRQSECLQLLATYNSGEPPQGHESSLLYIAVHYLRS